MAAIVHSKHDIVTPGLPSGGERSQFEYALRYHQKEKAAPEQMSGLSMFEQGEHL
jgi:hypothetical protein